jgi:hypothetical protein
MDILINEFISQIGFDVVQNHLNMQVIPLFSEQKEIISYLTLKEALEKRLLIIEEISKGGSVPELKVINLADVPVLLLDGEELAGAKQNRILNTTILVNAKAEQIIPVSCTERGRWSYRTDKFYDSGTVSPSFLRADKLSSVNISLKESGTFQSNQSRVWENVESLSRAANVQSTTGAMKDVFEQKKDTLEDYIKAFRFVPSQKGIFVFVDGEIAGWDILSRETAFEELFKKLIKSYAMDALIKNRGKITISRNPIEEARRFLEEVKECQGKKYPSTGLGEDYRFEGSGKVGSALVVEKQVIHMAFFKTGQKEQVDPMSGCRKRREYRI